MGRFVFLKMLLKEILLASVHLYSLARLKIFLVLVGFISYVLGFFGFVVVLCCGSFCLCFCFICLVGLVCFFPWKLSSGSLWTIQGKIEAGCTHLPLSSSCTHLIICKAHFFLNYVISGRLSSIQ